MRIKVVVRRAATGARGPSLAAAVLAVAIGPAPAEAAAFVDGSADAAVAGGGIRPAAAPWPASRPGVAVQSSADAPPARAPGRSGGGNDILAASCSQRDVQAAIDSAADGDTVRVPAGVCTWTETVSISNRMITLKGAGAGPSGTVVAYGGTGHSLIAIAAATASGTIDVSGFRFVGGDRNYWGGTAIRFSGPAGWGALRIHDNVFDGNRQWSIRGSAATSGLADHNTFQGVAHGFYLEGRGDADWLTPLTLGSADFFFVEDNLFDFEDSPGGVGAVAGDHSNGGRVVYRRNTIRNAFLETHDRARNGAPSANAWEIYENTFVADSRKWKAIDLSAGTGVVWGNAFVGDWSVPIGAINYKSFDPRGIPLCDGSDPADQNTPGQKGWRCQYQIGSQGKGPDAIGYPAVIWSNVQNGAAVGMVCTSGCEQLVEGRDFVNSGPTPKPGYVPYRYPHPLQGTTSPGRSRPGARW